MSSTVKLPYIRFVKRVSNGASLSKYGYIGMMQQNAESIQTAPWVAASSPSDSVSLTTNQLTKTDGVFDAGTGAWTTPPTYTAYMDDIYDCFKQAGDAVARNATMCGYAGCVAYRFKLPTSATANAINSISLSLQRDRYLRSGVRLGLSLSNSDTPSDDWSVVRGEATGCVRSESTAPAEGVVGVSSFGFLGQPDVPYLTEAIAAVGVISIDTSTAFAAAASYQYLYLYITVEDPSGRWNLYSANETRQYYIEGSAMLIADNSSFTFAEAPAAGTPKEFAISTGDSTFGLSGVTLPLDYRLHRVAATDLTMISANGAPVVIRNGDAVSYDLNDLATSSYGVGISSLIYAMGPGNPQSSGAPSIYRKFREDSFVRCKAEITNQTAETPAASFCIAFFGPEFNTVALFRKKVLLPFTLPGGFRPNRVKLDWRDYGEDTNYADIGTVNMRHNLWISKGDLSMNYSLETLQRHELYTAEIDAVGSFRLVGTFFHQIEQAQEGDPDFTQTLSLPYVLENGPFTLLTTVFIDQDQIAFDSAGLPTQEMIPQGQYAAYKTNGILFGSSGITYDLSQAYFALKGGWSPNITFLE